MVPRPSRRLLGMSRKLFLFTARFCAAEGIADQEVSNEYWCSGDLLGVMSLKDSVVGMVCARVGRAAIGAISYLAGLLLAGVGGVVVGALLTAMILGAPLVMWSQRFCIAFWAAFRRVESFQRAISDQLGTLHSEGENSQLQCGQWVFLFLLRTVPGWLGADPQTRRWSSMRPIARDHRVHHRP
jgi:hypothetical protein